MKKQPCILVLLPLILFQLGAAPVQSDFKSPWWCKGAHSQTIGGSLFRKGIKADLIRERIDTPDGDFIDVDWMKGQVDSPMVVILPGLGSSSEAPYVRALLRKVFDSDWQAVVLNPRGTFGNNRLHIMDHSGRTADLDFLVNLILQRKLSVSIFIVGFSAGGNKVLKWLGEDPSRIPSEVKKAAAVSVPYDLEKAVHNLDRGFDLHVYTRLMLKNLKRMARAKQAQLPQLITDEILDKADNFTVYDREITAQLGGFKDEKDYWAQSSCRPHLIKIRTQTLLIHAVNDPFLHGDELPLADIGSSGYLHLLLTEDGGHLGFVTGHKLFRADDWLEQTIMNYFWDVKR